ncbi:MAG: PKD domain-containing protein, partial [Flavobacteriales bacterium]
STIQDVATDVVQRADGGYTFIGSKEGQVTLTRTNALGVEISTAYFFATDLEAPYDYPIRGPFSLELTSDGGYIFIAKKAGEEKMMLVKTDALGSEEWMYEIGENDSAPFGGAKQTSDGGYIIASGNRVDWDTQTRPYLVKLNSAGTFQWDRRFTSGITGQFSDVVECDNGDLAACGTLRLSYNGPYDDFYLVRVNSNGNSSNPSCFADLIYSSSPQGCGSELSYFTSGSTFAQWYVNLNDGPVSTLDQGILTLEPGDYGLSLTAVTSDGCVASDEDSVFVDGPFLVDAGADILACQQPAQLMAQTTPPDNYTFEWTPAIPQLSNPNVVSPTVSGGVDSVDFTVTVTNPNGCSVSDVVNVTQQSWLNDSLDLCDGFATIDLGPGATNYDWLSWTDTDGNNHPLSLPQTQQSLNVNEPGQYFAVAYFPECGAMTSLVTVIPCVDCENFFTYNSSPQQCVESYSFVAGSSTQIVSYSWDFGDGATSTLPQPTHYYSAGIYHVTLTTTDVDGCVSTSTQTVSCTIGHSVNMSNDTVACQEEAYMEAFPYAGSGDFSYEWFPSEGLTDPYSAVTHVSGVHEQTYVCEVTDNVTGCTVGGAVTVSSYVANFDTIYLCGDSVELDLGPGGDFYNWTPYYNDDYETQSIWVEQTGDYLAYASFPACGAITSVFPVVECPSTCTSSIFNNGLNYVNCGAEVNLGATYSSPIDSAIWDMGDGTIVVDNGGGVPTHFYEGGSYVVALTAYHQGGCVSTTSYGLTLLTDVVVEINAEDTIACAGQVFLSATATGGGGHYAYYWPQSGSITPSTVEVATYNQWMVVQVTDTYTGCTVWDSIYVFSNQEINQTIEMCQSSVPLMVDPGSQIYNWTFTDPSGTTVSLPNQTNELDALNLGTYTCMTYYSGCLQVEHTFEVVQCGTACSSDFIAVPNPMQCGYLYDFAGQNFIHPVDSVVWDYGDGETYVDAGGGTAHFYGPGTYVATMTTYHLTGCVSTSTQTIDVTNGIGIELTEDSVACNGTFFPNYVISGGSGNYTYSWSPAALMNDPTSANPIMTASANTWVDVVLTDTQQGCSVSDSMFVYANLPILDSLQLCSDSVLTVDPGSMIYQWSYTDEFGNNTQLQEFGNQVTATSAGHYICSTYSSGCNTITHTFVVEECIIGSDDVWPGDANSDNIVTNADALYLGLAFGQTGPTRPAATINWVGQPAADWTFNFAANNVNLKHADCDGNGIVNFDDTLAIDFNYLNTHSKFEAPPAGGNPPIWIEATPDTVGLEHVIDIVVHLGTADQPVADLHGVAFSLTFDEALVQQQGMSLNFDNCVLGTAGADVLTFQKTMFLDGAIDIAVTRNTLIDFDGYGPIVHGRIVTTDNLSGYADLPIGVSGITALSAEEEDVLLSVIGDTVHIDPDKVGIVEP